MLNNVDIADCSEENDCSMEVDIETVTRGCRFPKRQVVKPKTICPKEERNASIKKVSAILQKSEELRTFEEIQLLKQCSETVKEVQLRWKKRDEAKRRLKEVEDPIEELEAKCKVLAHAIAQSQHLIVYTGAGISTAANIPDYRGSNGIWTRLQQGKDIGNHDLSSAEPTYTHMALFQLYQQNILKYVVSQNCDGLHLRSGLPRFALSELHGNMYIEVCKNCKPTREYLRLFDVTENTARFSHKTMRKCYLCNGPLLDTIVHFGEKGSLQWPLNWKSACKNAQKATTILCLGSSLKVLKHYPWLWQMHKPVKERPNLYIVNLQWTPKDECANVKIHGKCDIVMNTVMNMLGISVPFYDKGKDPIFHHATILCDKELHTTSQPFLKLDEKFGQQKNANTVNIDSKIDKKGSWAVQDKEHIEIKTESPNEEKENKSSIRIIDNYGAVNHSFNDLMYKSGGLDINSIQSNITNCDNTSNSHVKVKYFDSQNSCHNHDTTDSGTLECLPIKNDSNILNVANNQHKSVFTIDNILKKDNSAINISHKESKRDPIKNTSFVRPVPTPFSGGFLHHGLQLSPNYEAFLAYYHLANTFLQNPLLSYHDMFYYPYQTSFLYSGLHSIINTPVFSCSSGKLNTDSMKNCETLENKHFPDIKDELLPCTFCSNQFKSNICLFYSKIEPLFIENSKQDSSKFVCLCCEDSSDEDVKSLDDMEKNSQLCDKDEKLEITQTVTDDKEQLKGKIQPGWYGKGFRKLKRPRKT